MLIPNFHSFPNLFCTCSPSLIVHFEICVAFCNVALLSKIGQRLEETN
jgi:hypothetical protein